MRHTRIAGLLAVVVVAGCTRSPAPIQIFVAASVSDLAGAWQGEVPSSLAFQYHAGGSMMLANQIVAGARADLLLAAGPSVLERLYERDLVALVDSGYLHNRLVLVCAPNVSAPDSLPGLLEPRFERIAVADPDLAPAGSYTRQGLRRAGLWEALQGRIIITGNVRSALAAVASRAADAGFVYETDALMEPSLSGLRFEPDSHFPPVRYPLVMLKPARDESRARWSWLHTPEARTHARRYGFK